jgi:3-oxoacyl-[acyl-carrier-protein] synthase-3
MLQISGGQGTPVIAGISYVFPSCTRSVRELAQASMLESSADTLESFGFSSVHVGTTETPYDLARQSVEKLIAEHSIDPESVGLLIYGGTPGAMAFRQADEADKAGPGFCTKDRFKYPSARLQYDVGLLNASTFGLDQLACTTLLGAVRLARSLCMTEGIERAICVTSEFFPMNAGREAIFNCTSDAACAVLIERSGTRNRLISASTVTKGYYWDTDTLRDEVVGSYFPTARFVAEKTVDDAGWARGDVDWIIPHNVSLRSWQILSGLLRLPNAKLWSDNIARHGHTLAGDNFINYRDALDSGAIEPGQRVLLFSYGFGAHWTGVAVEA